jgi:predicted esterase
MTQIHETQPVAVAGADLKDAKAAMIAIHGRGASAHSILEFTNLLNKPHFAYRAPQAALGAWYPQRFVAPIAANEPYLTSALNTIDGLVKTLNENGFPNEQIMILGFSQGACLAVEYPARNGGRFGGIAALSGGLIGPPGTKWEFGTDLAETPVFIGCSDVDFHIPLERVKESTAALTSMGARVDERIYPGMGHTVNEDEIAAVKAMMEAMI